MNNKIEFNLIHWWQIFYYYIWERSKYGLPRMSILKAIEYTKLSFNELMQPIEIIFVAED